MFALRLYVLRQRVSRQHACHNARTSAACASRAMVCNMSPPQGDVASALLEKKARESARAPLIECRRCITATESVSFVLSLHCTTVPLAHPAADITKCGRCCCDRQRNAIADAISRDMKQSQVLRGSGSCLRFFICTMAVHIAEGCKATPEK
jgi:hypothetical protein